MKLYATLCPGRGKGQSLVSDNVECLRSVLKKAPFPGTLNLLLDDPFLIRPQLRFGKKGKYYGVLGEIEGVPCIVHRWRKAPLHVLEVIAAEKLRSHLNLTDGQRMSLHVPDEAMQVPSALRRWVWSKYFRDEPEAYYDDQKTLSFERLKYIYRLSQQTCFDKKEATLLLPSSSH